MLKKYISRFIAVREYDFSKNSVSDLMVLDRKKQQLLTFPDCKPFLPLLSGGVLTYPSGYAGIPTALRVMPDTYINNTISFTNHPLDSAYTAGSAGDAAINRFTPHDTLTLEKVYFHIASFAGTAANVNDLNLEIRSATDAVTVNTAGGGLLASASIDPTKSASWNGFTGLSVSVSPENFYFVIVADADGNGTDFARVDYSISNYLWVAESFMTGHKYSFTTTNGATTISGVNVLGSHILFFSSGEVLGIPFSTAAVSSGTASRGGKFTGGMPVDLLIHGAVWRPSTSNSVTAANIWTGSTGPSGTPFLTSTTYMRRWDSTGNRYGFYFSTPTTLPADTSFRLTFDHGASASTVGKLSIGTGADANLRLAMPGNGNWIWTEESGGSWSDDSDAAASVGLICEELESLQAGGERRIHPVFPSERVFPIYSS